MDNKYHHVRNSVVKLIFVLLLIMVPTSAFAGEPSILLKNVIPGQGTDIFSSVLSNGTIIFNLTSSGIITRGTLLNYSQIPPSNPDRVLTTNSSGYMVTSAITTTLLNYLANVSSDIQTQLNAMFNNITESNTVNATIIGSNSSQKLVTKTLSAGTGIQLDTTADNIIIVNTQSAASGFNNLANTNTANTTAILADNSTVANRATFKTLSPGSGITLTNDANNIVITSTGGSDTTVVSQISTTNATIIADNSTSSNNVRLKGIAAGTGILVHNGTNTITIFSSVTDTDTGFTNLASTDITNATIIAENATSPTTRATFKTISAGSGIQVDNGTNSIIIKNTVVDTDTNTTVLSQISPTNATVIADNSTSTNNVRIKGIAGGSGIQIDNGTNTLTIKQTYINVLTANATTTLAGTDYESGFTIPLTASSGNSISGLLIGTDVVSGIGIRYTANVTQATSVGICMFTFPSALSTLVTGAYVLNSSNPTANTNAFNPFPASAGVPQLYLFECSVHAGSTPGNLRILFNSETVGQTVTLVKGSYYIKTP